MTPDFDVTVAAVDLQLLTVQQLRVGAGLEKDDSSMDEELAELGLRIAEDIATACNIPAGGVNIPTFRSETVTNTFFTDEKVGSLILSRRFVSSIISVTEDGVILDTDDYRLHGESGLLDRRVDNWPSVWGYRIVVQYVAGFSVVPPGLVGPAQSLLQWRISEGRNDPLIKSIRTSVPDMEDRQEDRWVGAVPGSDSGGTVPADILRRLARYINP